MKSPTTLINPQYGLHGASPHVTACVPRSGASSEQSRRDGRWLPAAAILALLLMAMMEPTSGVCLVPPNAVGHVTIPDMLTSIPTNAFYNCSTLRSVAIPDSVTVVGGNAFKYCFSLTRVTLPDSVREIGHNAFFYCRRLASLRIPDSVAVIRSGAFFRTSSLAWIVLPNTNISLGLLNGVENPPGVLASCLGYGLALANGSQPRGNVTCIPCAGQRTIVLPDTVTHVGAHAFNGCDSIEVVLLPNNVTAIGDYAFYNTPSLSSIFIPDTVAAVGRGLTCLGYGLELATRNSPRGRDVTCVPCNTRVLDIPDTVVAVNRASFGGCSDVESIVIPDSVVTIGPETFHMPLGSRVSQVFIPNSVTSVHPHEFPTCLGFGFRTAAATPRGLIRCFPETAVPAVPDTVVALGGFAFQGLAVESVRIPDSVTRLETLAFIRAVSLRSVHIPNSVTVIERGCFYEALSLPSVVIPNSVTFIGELAFFGCTLLTSLTISRSISTLPPEVFRGCFSLPSVSIPNGLTSIGTHAFEGCPALKSITIPSSVSSIANDSFANCGCDAALYVAGATLCNCVNTSCGPTSTPTAQPTQTPTADCGPNTQRVGGTCVSTPPNDSGGGWNNLVVIIAVVVALCVLGLCLGFCVAVVVPKYKRQRAAIKLAGYRRETANTVSGSVAAELDPRVARPATVNPTFQHQRPRSQPQPALSSQPPKASATVRNGAQQTRRGAREPAYDAVPPITQPTIATTLDHDNYVIASTEDARYHSFASVPHGQPGPRYAQVAADAANGGYSVMPGRAYQMPSELEVDDPSRYEKFQDVGAARPPSGYLTVTSDDESSRNVTST
eukprot:m.130859 g.130859  ORF g.130859 m.130859 type:complete len:837 (+) comp13732_c0_seq2:281-2791(+)